MDKARENSIEKQISQLTRLIENNHKVYLSHFAQIDRRFEHVDRRFAKIDQRFKSIDQRFKDIDQRFEMVDQRFEDMEQSFDKRFNQLEQKIEKHTQASEIRSTNLLNICTALRADMRSLRSEREQESHPLLS